MTLLNKNLKVLEMKSLLRVVACLSLCVSLNSFGALYNISLEGNITNVPEGLEESVFIGDNVSAFFLFSTSEFSSIVEFESERFFYNSSLISYEMNMGMIQASGGGGRIEISNDIIENNQIIDRLILQSSGGLPQSQYLNGNFDLSSLHIGATFLDYDASAFNEGYPFPTISLTDFETIALSIQYKVSTELDPEQFIVLGARASSAELSEVPLPAGIYLFLSGLVGLGLMRGRNA